MSDWTADFMPREVQLFRRNVGEIIAHLVRSKFPRDTAKHLQRSYDLEPSTAKNVARGHVSPQSLTSILHGEGDDVFDLLDAIGHALTGKTRHEWEEQKYQRIIEEAERAQDGIRQLRLRRALLAESAMGSDEACLLDSPTALREARRRTG